MLLTLRSPSSRRAWIEIYYGIWDNVAKCVALLAEGVDRNCPVSLFLRFCLVALLAEGVDRNILTSALTSMLAGRPPRGGRG